MKTIKNITTLFLLIVVGLNSGCKKDPVMYGKGIESFKFIVKGASNTETEYPGVISGDEIIVALPTEIDVTNLKASFTIDNPRTIVQVDAKVQESGISEQDFSQPISYKVKAEDKSTRSYSVRIEKKIALQSFGFFKADNPGVLEEDYQAVIRGLTIDISVHETIDLTKLVARFQTTTGSTLKVGPINQESKVTSNNFGNPVVYSFTDAGLPAPLNFNVQLSFIGPKWWIIGEKSIVPFKTNGIKLAIHPFSKMPYVTYYKGPSDDAGVTVPDSLRRVGVISYNGTGWENLGKVTGISPGKADEPVIDFGEEGTPYLGYKDYFNSDERATVKKYVNDTWINVGTERFTPMKADKYSFAIGENNQPIIALSIQTTPGFTRRSLYVSNYTNGIWGNVTPATANPLLIACRIFRGLNGKTYLAILDRSSNVSMFKLVGNTWQPVGPVGFRASDGLPGYTSVIGAVATDGTAYIGFQTVSSSQRLNRIMKFNGTNWVEIGSAGSSQDQDEKYALAIAPDGKLYFAYANTTGLYMRTLNTITNNWNTPRIVISGKVNAFDMKVASDGIPYLALSANSDGRISVYKYTNTK
ncbi:hypothetical protein FBD94_14350 [Pedobacter hiemivivus]|uniref:DUF5018 domain-containing protein n=1 Tax=Pedobacter hiemivivus TaxID=2530454 RepID=A0A4R0NGP9_9SPHI|nr:hypothetical protein [Pedobacter hiemivivus]TCC97904.1 hypothetical protein EZ444_08315 [Pedobacter hiemivivus]TKC60095.1 hypothetical protein FBD94_14350 [Pedobacter hiemivivus]